MTLTPALDMAQRIQARLTRLLYRVIRWLPLPAQDRWNTSLQLFRLHVRLLDDVVTQQEGPMEAEMLVSKTLRLAGRRWVERRLLWSKPSPPSAQVVGDTCTVAVKTLNVASHVSVAPQKVAITTFFCPFLDDAERAGEDPAGICQRICGESGSFFKGVSEGFPFYVRYSAPLMMGRGAKTCLKEIQL